MTVVGTRPEIIKLSRVMAALDKAVDHVVLHTGQNYDKELNQIFFEQMNIRKPDYRITSEGSIPTMMAGLQYWLPVLKPDVILILGDTNSCFCTAYVAARLHIPLVHLEAGNRCFNFDTPEELNRVIIDHIPGLQLCYSERSRENLVNEGVPTQKVIKVGSPMNEVLDHYAADINSSQVLSQLKLTPKEYFVVSCHREENTTPEKFQDFLKLLDGLTQKYQHRIVLSAHPRLRKLMDQKFWTNPLVEIYAPFGMFDYCKLQQNARCTLSDSGTISEESSILNFPALMLRESHERPECDEEGGIIMTGFDCARVMESLDLSQQPICTPDAYCSLNVSEKVVKLVLSHTRRK